MTVLIVKSNLSQVNQDQWKVARAKSNPYRKLDVHYYPYIAGYAKWTSRDVLGLVIYRIAEILKTICGMSDRQKCLKEITTLVKVNDPRFIFFPSKQAKESAKVILALALKANEREKKYPKKTEEEIYSELTKWLQKECVNRNVQLGTIRNLGLNFISYLAN